MKSQTWISQLKHFAKEVKKNLFVLYFAYRDKRTPWHAKTIAVLVVACAFSPIDLIPDFIPIIVYLDDLILVPLGIGLAMKLIPDEIIQENREKAELLRQSGKPKNWLMGSFFILIWLSFLIWLSNALYANFF